MEYSLAKAVETGLEYLAEYECEVTHTQNHIEQWSMKALTEYPPCDSESGYHFLWGAMSGYNFALVLSAPTGLNRWEEDAYFAGVAYGEQSWSDDNFDANLTQ